MPTMAAEGTSRGNSWRLVGSPVWSQIILNTRPQGYRPKAGIWDMSQPSRKGLNSNGQENTKTELYFKHVISRHVVLGSCLSLGVAGLILLVRAGALAGDYCGAWNRKGKGLQCLWRRRERRLHSMSWRREKIHRHNGRGRWQSQCLRMKGLTASLAIKISCLKLKPESQSKKSLNIHFEGKGKKKKSVNCEIYIRFAAMGLS